MLHVLFLVFVIPLFVLHFLPAIISGIRHTRNFVPILLINIFLGWTVIAWIIVLVWSLRDEPRYIVYPSGPPYTR